MTTFLLTVIIIAAIMAALALAAVLSGRCLRLSCGRADATLSDGEEETCGTCGRKKKVDNSVGSAQ